MDFFRNQIILYLSVLAFVSLHFPQSIEGKPKGRRIDLQIDTNPSYGFSNGSTEPLTQESAEISRRLCLSRLREALKVACGGSGRIPLYFDPSVFYNRTFARIDASERAKSDPKNLRNDISAMAATYATYNQRRLQRRRSRRNIVRACCHKPCPPSYLKNYCSSTIRSSSPEILQDSSQSSSLSTKHMNGAKSKLSDTQRKKVSFSLLQDGSQQNVLPYVNSINHTLNDFTASQTNNFNNPATLQCVTVADLQTFYHFILEKVWRKGMGNDNWAEQLTPQPFYDDDSISNPRQNDLFSTNAYAVATNEMRPTLKEFLNQIINMKRQYSSFQQPSSTEKVTTEETVTTTSLYEDEEVIDADVPENTHHRSSNIETAKPLPIMIISIPKGTNDYIY